MYVMQNDLFFYHPWLDIPFHIGGGFLIGLLYYNYVLLKGKEFISANSIWFLVGLSLTIGIAWEVLELVFGLNKVFGTDDITIDTIFDLVNDVIGALLVPLLVYMLGRPLSDHFGFEKKTSAPLNSHDE